MSKVSIITPCYNAASFLPITYESVMSQNHSDWEWILIDDKSTDNTWQLLQELAKRDVRLKIFQNNVNSGAAVTRNNCIEKAAGKYLAFLDSDDLWMPTKLSEQTEFMQKTGSLFCYHDYVTIDSKGNHLKNHLLEPNVSQKDLLKFNPYATSSVMVDAEVVRKNNIRFPPHLRRRQDYLFWYEALRAAGGSQNVGKILSSYRIFGKESLSANKKEMAKIQWNLYRNEFKLGLIPSVYYFFHYAWHGIKKYFLLFIGA